MTLPSHFDILLACWLLAGLQGLVLLRFLWMIRADSRRVIAPDFKPRVAVLVACAGETPGFAQNIRSLLAQDYAGEVEFVFVTPSTEDPAYRALKELLRASGAKNRLLATGLVPERASGKIVDLLYAIERLPSGTEVLAFADADVRVPPGWLGGLVGALAEDGVGIATALMLYVPSRPSLGAWMRMAWMGSGMPYFDMMANITGQSCAIRKSDFENLGVAELWSRSFLEDLALTRRVRGWEKKVRFVYRSAPHALDESGAADMLRVFVKWMAAYRIYDMRVWGLGAIVTAFKACAVAWSLVPPASLDILALVFGMDMAALFFVFVVLGRYLPDRFENLHPAFRPLPLAAALAAPLLQFVYCIAYAGSLLSRDIVWGPYTYRVRGPQDVEVIAGPKVRDARS